MHSEKFKSQGRVLFVDSLIEYIFEGVSLSDHSKGII